MTDILINGRFLSQPITGVQRVARELLREIDGLVGEQSQSVKLAIACEPNVNLNGLDLRNITVEVYGGASGHFWEQLVLPWHVGNRHLLCLANTAPLLSVLSGKRVAVMIHDVSYRFMPSAYSRSYRMAHSMLLPLLMRFANPIFTVSVTEKERLSKLRSASSARIFAVQNGGWHKDRIEARAAPAGAPTMLYVGSLSRRKNIDGVVAVAIRLMRESGVRTIIVGSRSDILAPIGLKIPPDVADGIEFVGQVPDLETLADYYRDAACLLFPSRYEASPLPPIEAMSFGCPVVASAIPSMTERCGMAALYCNPDDPDDMLATVKRVLQDAPLADELRKRGFKQANLFSWRRQAEQILGRLVSA